MNTKKLIAVALAAGTMSMAVHARQPARVTDTIAQRAVACVACHGKEGRATAEGYFPRIAGKPQEYLYKQLLNFREGRRQNPQMTYMVAHLSDEYLDELAGYFASQHPPYPAPVPANVSPQVIERGRVLAMQGDPSRKLPACVACHGEKLTGVNPAIPGLLGLPRDYLNSQFGAWKTGARKASSPDCMAHIAGKLSVDEISAVSAWLSSQPLPADMRPANSLTAKLPLPCGLEHP